DGASNPNGAGNSLGMPTNPVEYVASYSAYGTPSSIQLHSSSAWGIVAPGGVPANVGSDNDQLHWIENINTTTPFDSNFGTVPCTPDYPGTGAADCRVLIAGTSMSTPVVAGAAALILAVKPGYQSPSLMKQLLCQTADDIGDPNDGCGRLNVYRAMATALADRSPPPF
ncbi:MAG: S8 family serine peptidase, partial [Vulcanimicrobiaceae bacterium]